MLLSFEDINSIFIPSLFRMQLKMLALGMIHWLWVLNSSLLLSVVVVNICDISIIAIEDPRDLFKSWALSFDVEEENEDKLDSDPNLSLLVFWKSNSSMGSGTYSIETPEVPVVRKVFESDGVGLVTDGESNLNEEVHDHEATSTESEWADFQSVSDNKTGPGNRVADVEEPNKGNLGVS